MVRVHIWLRKREGMTEDQFRDYLLNDHAPIARDGYQHLQGYAVHLVTRVPEGQEAPYDGIAVLTWDDRDGFSADIHSGAARRAGEDLAAFTARSGLLFVDEHIVK